MLKFHIDLAEAAAKTLRANFLEANLKAVIYSTAQTLLLSDSLTFFSPSRVPPTFITAFHPPVRVQAVSRLQIFTKNISCCISLSESTPKSALYVFTSHCLHLL